MVKKGMIKTRNAIRPSFIVIFGYPFFKMKKERQNWRVSETARVATYLSSYRFSKTIPFFSNKKGYIPFSKLILNTIIQQLYNLT